MNCKKFNGDCLNQSSTCLPVTDQPWNLETSPLSSKAPSTSNIQRLGITTKCKSGPVIQMVTLIFKVLNCLTSALSPILTTVLCDLLLVLKHSKPVPRLAAFAFTALPAWSMPPPTLPTSGSFSSFRSSSNATSSELISSSPEQNTCHYIILTTYRSLKFIFISFLASQQPSLQKHRFQKSMVVLITGAGAYRLLITIYWMNRCSLLSENHIS